MLTQVLSLYLGTIIQVVLISLLVGLVLGFLLFKYWTNKGYEEFRIANSEREAAEKWRHFENSSKEKRMESE